VTSTAALDCRDLLHEPGFCNGLSITKTGNTATASESKGAIAERRKFGSLESPRPADKESGHARVGLAAPADPPDACDLASGGSNARGCATG